MEKKIIAAKDYKFDWDSELEDLSDVHLFSLHHIVSEDICSAGLGTVLQRDPALIAMSELSEKIYLEKIQEIEAELDKRNIKYDKFDGGLNNGK